MEPIPDNIKRELEAKYVIKPKDIDRIEDCLKALTDDGKLMLAGTRDLLFTDYYFDTPDLLLAYNNCSLRLRERSGHPTKLTFKRFVSRSNEGLHTRIEVEGIPTQTLIKRVLENAPWLAIRQGEHEREPLAGHVEMMHAIGVFNSFRINNHRKIYTVVTPDALYAEVAVDQGKFQKDDVRKALIEFEIEYLSGDASGMQELCDTITSRLGGLKHNKKSKYLRGLRQLGMWKENNHPNNKRYKRWKKVLDKLHQRLIRHLDEASYFDDPGSLHDTRVTIRRMLALMQFLPATSEEGSSGSHLYMNLEAIHKRLGKVRDMDVLIEQFTVDEPGDSSLLNLLEMKRNESVLRSTKFLSAINFSKLHKQWSKFVRKELKSELSNAPLEQYYINLKHRLGRSLAEFGRSTEMRGPTHPLSIKKLHRSRITLKELRYATEYLHLIAPGSQPVETRHFKELQDQLGSVIDLANAVKYLRELNNDLDGILNSKLAELIDDIQNQFLATLEDIEIDTGRFPIYHETEGRDLTDVKGIGDKTKELLLSAGIRSLDDLAQLENIQLEQQQGLSDQLVARAIREDWIAQARKLAL